MDMLWDKAFPEIGRNLEMEARGYFPSASQFSSVRYHGGLGRNGAWESKKSLLIHIPTKAGKLREDNYSGILHHCIQ